MLNVNHKLFFKDKIGYVKWRLEEPHRNSTISASEGS